MIKLESAAPGHPIRFDVFTLFPDFFDSPLQQSIPARGRSKGLINIHVHDIRNWTTDRHRSADDTPYGGGAGMVMMAPPIVHAVEETVGSRSADTHIVFLSASGRLFSQAVAGELAAYSRLALVCGHYEGFDQRAVDILEGDEISIGDYVLTGGEIPALVVIDAVSRLIPGVIDHASLSDESHQAGLLEYPQYTRPASFRGHDVPPTLLSGHHANIERWRHDRALVRTAERRPDLLENMRLTPHEREVLDSYRPRETGPDREPADRNDDQVTG